MQNDQLIEQATRLQNEGYSLREIEANIGVSKSRIQRLLKPVTPIDAIPKSPSARATSGTNLQLRPPVQRSTLPEGLVGEKAQKHRQALELDGKIAQKHLLLGALTNDLSTKEQQRNMLDRKIEQQLQQLDQSNRQVAQMQAELDALTRRLVNLPLQQEALEGQQKRFDWERQTFDQLLAKTRPQLETYQAFRIRFGGEGLVNCYNNLIQDLLDHCDHCRWYARSLADFMERRWQLHLDVEDFCAQYGLLPASLLLCAGLEFMGQDLEEDLELTKGFFGAWSVEIHFSEPHIQRYKAYMVTEIAQPKSFLALPLPLSPYQLIE